MIVGFLGKGGSGKTTLATLMVQYLREQDVSVLAIDNDHNMDLAFNLAQEEQDMPYIGQALDEVYAAVGVGRTLDILDKEPDAIFSLSPIDPLTLKYSKELSTNVRLMVSGPHTQKILVGAECSHVLTMPLKVYLPFLRVQAGEYVIVDEKAGADGVGTGVTTGFNAALVVAEGTTHGIKAALQIARLLDFYKTPYAFVFNKVRASKSEELEELLPQKPVAVFYADEQAMDLSLNDTMRLEFKNILAWLKGVKDSRHERVVARLQKLQEEIKK